MLFKFFFVGDYMFFICNYMIFCYMFLIMIEELKVKSIGLVLWFSG